MSHFFNGGNGFIPDKFCGGEHLVHYQFPFDEKFTFGTPFGKKGTSWKCGYHSGLDMNSRKYGSSGKVRPVAPGKVESINKHGSAYGNHICIRHEDGYVSLYAHLQKICVKKGDVVDYNSVLGIEGTTGNSTGNHLHLEIHKGQYRYPATIDPKKFIEERVLNLSTIRYKLPNGKTITTDGVMIDGTNYGAIRQLLEAMGYVVGWDNNTKTILIEGKK